MEACSGGYHHAMRIALITLALTQLMNIAFVGWLKHAGLALSIGLASCFNAGMLWLLDFLSQHITINGTLPLVYTTLIISLINIILSFSAKSTNKQQP